MTIEEINKELKEIWGEESKDLSRAIVVWGKVFGDICRYERNAKKDAGKHTEEELKKEIGNMITVGIKTATMMGFDPGECLKIALEVQKQGKEELEEV